MQCDNEKVNELFYNKTADKYETTGRISQEGNKERVRYILKRVIEGKGKDVKILDVCCGAGLYLSILKDLISEENLNGLDISPVARIHNIKSRIFKVLLVWLALKKLYDKISTPDPVEKEDKKPEDLSLEELHKISEAQNYYYDGVHASVLGDVLSKTGFSESELFVYNSHKWNEGVRFSWFSSMFNNKIYSVSTK